MGYEISVQVGGTLDNPEVGLSSIPPLPQEELLLFVVTGAPPGSVGAEGGSLATAASPLAVYLGKNVVGQLFGGRSRAGKSGFQDRIELQIGRELTRAGSVTLDARLLLKKDPLGHGSTLYITSEKDIYDQYNAGLKVIFKFKWGPEQSDAPADENRKDGTARGCLAVGDTRSPRGDRGAHRGECRHQHAAPARGGRRRAGRAEGSGPPASPPPRTPPSRCRAPGAARGTRSSRSTRRSPARGPTPSSCSRSGKARWCGWGRSPSRGTRSSRRPSCSRTSCWSGRPRTWRETSAPG